MQVIKKIVVRTFKTTLVCILVVIVGLVLALQTAGVQTWLAGKATKWVSGQLGMPVSIGYVEIHWLDKATFKKVLIQDRQRVRMIYVPELSADFDLSKLAQTNGDISIDEAVLDGAQVRLVRRIGSSGLNIDEFIEAINRLTASADTTMQRKRRPVFSIDRVSLRNTYFSFDDQRKDSIRNGFDYQHFAFDNIHTQASNFRLVADTIEVNIRKLQGVNPQTKLNVKELKSFFRYTKHSMALTGLTAHIGNSIIGDSIVFNYNRPGDLSDFNEKVIMQAHLEGTRIYSKDLALFAPYLNRYEENWSISGDFSGKVVRFRLRNADLHFGYHSMIHGNISFSGLPDFGNTFIDFALRPSVLEASDLKQYVTDTAAFRNVAKFGTIKLSGKFLGFPKDFVANGNFDTDLGQIVSNINLKIRENEAKSYYKGRLKTVNLDIGTLSGQPALVQRLDMNGRIEGTGLKIRSATFKINANVDRIGLRGYNYRRININGRLSQQEFQGNVSVNDANLVFAAKGEIDLRNGRNLINVQGNLQHADLQGLRFTRENTVIRTRLDVNVRGIEKDEIIGNGLFTDGFVTYGSRNIRIDSLFIRTNKDAAAVRDFSVQSDFATVSAKGDFEFKRLFEDVKQLIGEYSLNFSNDEANIQTYYRKKKSQARQRYRLEYLVDLKDINPILSLFYPEVYISRNTRVEGNFANGLTSIARINSQIDTIVFRNYHFYGNEIDISTSKLADSSDVLASTYLFSRHQQLSTAPPSDSLALEAIWSGKNIDFEGTIAQANNTNLADLKGDLWFRPGRIEVQFKPSYFRILNNEWHITANNLIDIRGREVTFSNLAVSNQNQMITLEGSVSESLNEDAELTLREFDLRTLNPLLAHQLRGVVNGYINIRDFYNSVNLESELKIEELVVDNFLIGDIDGVAKWESSDQRVHVNYNVFRQDEAIVTLTGTYDPKAETDKINMRAVLNQTHIDVLQSFFNGLISKVAGTATGRLSISGTLDAPVVKGSVIVSNGQFNYNYLNTLYHFDGPIYFTENEIGVRNLRLYDEDNHVAIVKGGVYHDGFRQFGVDLTANMQEFKVLNTTFRDNDLFYGTAYVTGTLTLLGAFENLDVRVTAKSNKGTRIAIPVTDTREITGEEEYIRFISKKQRIQPGVMDTVVKGMDLSGIRLDFNFDLTPDAYCEIIFDQKAGDIIRGNGRGRIKMLIDTHGDFSMFGNYTINQGWYNFTLLNAVNKEFEIRPGSTVSWSGDPYGAQLNIDATYEQTASLLPLMGNLSETERNQPQLNRRYPVIVLLKLTGNLLQPDIDLGIDFTNYPKNDALISNVILDFENRVMADEQELNRQVFSLLILRKLSPEGTFSGIQGSVGNSLSELLANQLSYWASQVNENLEIDLNINGFSEEAFNTFQLRLSYSLLDGRLRVTRNGGFTNVQDATTAQSIIGDWTIEYTLSKDGALRVKMFSRNSQNLLTAGYTNSTNIVAGFSLLHTQSFNSLKDLFQRHREPPAIEEDPEEKDDKPTEPQTQVAAPARRPEK